MPTSSADPPRPNQRRLGLPARLHILMLHRWSPVAVGLLIALLAMVVLTRPAPHSANPPPITTERLGDNIVVPAGFVEIAIAVPDPAIALDRGDVVDLVAVASFEFEAVPAALLVTGVAVTASSDHSVVVAVAQDSVLRVAAAAATDSIVIVKHPAERGAR